MADHVKSAKDQPLSPRPSAQKGRGQLSGQQAIANSNNNKNGMSPGLEEFPF